MNSQKVVLKKLSLSTKASARNWPPAGYQRVNLLRSTSKTIQGLFLPPSLNQRQGLWWSEINESYVNHCSISGEQPAELTTDLHKHSWWQPQTFFWAQINTTQRNNAKDILCWWKWLAGVTSLGDVQSLLALLCTRSLHITSGLWIIGSKYQQIKEKPQECMYNSRPPGN